MKNLNRYLCGTPAIHCEGALMKIDKRHNLQCHSSPQEAFKCHRRYLIAHAGHSETANRRELLTPNGEIRVLTRPANFGAHIRRGKNENTGGGAIGSRTTFNNPVGNLGGTITSL